MGLNRQPVVVGVVRDQPMVVVTVAATFAQRFDADLVFASVDTSHYPVKESSEGAVIATPIDPDPANGAAPEFDPRLRATIAKALDGLSIMWSVRALAGGAAQQLARLADELDAAMIVVGTRERGIRGSLREFLDGSVAAQLAHRQRRPVVVVPLNPVEGKEPSPWHATEAGD